MLRKVNGNAVKYILRLIDGPQDTTVSLLRKLLLKKAKMLNVQTAVWFKKAKISNFNFQKRRKFFSYHPRKGF